VLNQSSIRKYRTIAATLAFLSTMGPSLLFDLNRFFAAGILRHIHRSEIRATPPLPLG